MGHRRMPKTTFRSASDLLCLSANQMAELFHRPIQTIRQMRLAPENPNYRPPPEGWEGVFARLARDRGGELLGLAMELERDAGAS